MYPFEFSAGGKHFRGFTLPGVARMRIFREPGKVFFVAFDPALDFPSGKVTHGTWSDIAEGTDLAVLQELAPRVVWTANKRLQAIRRFNARIGKKLKPDKEAKSGNGFDANYFYFMERGDPEP